MHRRAITSALCTCGKTSEASSSSLRSAPRLTAPWLRLVNQNLAHQPRSDGEKVRTILGLKRTLVHQPDVSLVNQAGALQRVARPFSLQMIPGNISQLLVNQRNQRLQCPLIARLPMHEQFGDWVGMLLIHGRLRPQSVT